MALTHISGTIAESKAFCYSSLPFERIRQLQIMSRETENILDMNIKDTDTWKALNNGGWTNRRLKDGYNCDDCKRAIAVKNVAVSEFGTYRVDLEFVAKNIIKGMSVFAGRRNMVSRGINLVEGEKYKKSFYIAVTPYIPALSAKKYEEKAVYVSFTHADSVELCTINVVKEDVPVIWVAGDSTLTDQNAGIPYYPYGSCAGWAQTLLRYTDKAAVCNLAHSGMTSNCFRDDGHYDIARQMIKRGDIFIIQFGHNDQKRRNLKAFEGYKDNLKRYACEVRELGAEPIICSPISRNSEFSLLKLYRDACSEVAKELAVPFIDLHDFSFKKWKEYGNNAKDYFIPGDVTHTNEYGAMLIADYFAKEMQIMTEDAHKDYSIEQAEKNLPEEYPGLDIFSIEPPYVDIAEISDRDGIRKAYNYGLLDPCVMYLHPEAVLPRAQLLMVMFKAFRMAGKRPYENKFSDINEYDWDAGYVQALIDEELIDDETIGRDEATGELLFRPDAPLKYTEFVSFLVRFLEKDISKRKQLTISECMKKADELKMKVKNETCKKHSESSNADRCIAENEKYEVAKGDNISRAEVYSGLAHFMDIAGGIESDLPSGLDIHPVH